MNWNSKARSWSKLVYILQMKYHVVFKKVHTIYQNIQIQSQYKKGMYRLIHYTYLICIWKMLWYHVLNQ